MTEVETAWLLRVRDLLEKLAYNPGALGEEAECLGSFIPDFLEPSQSNEARRNNLQPRPGISARTTG
jgi:hypothetical protein